MEKNRFIKVLTFTFAVGIASSVTAVQANAMAPKKQVTINNVTTQNAKEDEAQAAVYALFTDETRTVVKPDIKQIDIDRAKQLVDALDAGTVKQDLSILIFRAQFLFNQVEGKRIVYALFSDSNHNMIRKDLTLNEIENASAFVERTLPAGAIKVQLRVLIITARVQLEAREAVYGLFTDDSHTVIKPDLKQLDIDKAKYLIDTTLIDQWPIKEELSALVTLAQNQLDERNSKTSPQITEAEKMVYALFTDRTFTKLAPGVNKYTIENVRSIIKLLYPTELNQYLMHLLDVADSLL